MSFNITRLGDPSLPSLMLLHGFGSHKSIWDPFLNALYDHFCIYCCDLPGYGENKHIKMDTLAALSQRLVNELDKTVLWLGWSLGGLVVLDIARRYPEKCRGIITIGTSPCFIAQPSWPGIDPSDFKTFSQTIVDRPQKTLAQFQLLQVHGDKKAGEILDPLQRSSQFPVSDTAWQDSLRVLQETDLRASLSELIVPYLALFGAEDKIVPATIVPFLPPLTRQIRCHIIENAAHVPFLSEPTKVADLVVNFSQRITATQERSDGI